MEGDTATLTLPLKLRFGGGGGNACDAHYFTRFHRSNVPDLISIVPTHTLNELTFSLNSSVAHFHSSLAHTRKNNMQCH